MVEACSRKKATRETKVWHKLEKAKHSASAVFIWSKAAAAIADCIEVVKEISLIEASAEFGWKAQAQSSTSVII